MVRFVTPKTLFHFIKSYKNKSDKLRLCANETAFTKANCVIRLWQTTMSTWRSADVGLEKCVGGFQNQLLIQ